MKFDQRKTLYSFLNFELWQRWRMLIEQKWNIYIMRDDEDVNRD